MAVFPCCPFSTGSLYVLKFSFRNAQEPDGNCAIVTGRSVMSSTGVNVLRAQCPAYDAILMAK